MMCERQFEGDPSCFGKVLRTRVQCCRRVFLFSPICNTPVFFWLTRHWTEVPETYFYSVFRYENGWNCHRRQTLIALTLASWRHLACCLNPAIVVGQNCWSDVNGKTRCELRSCVKAVRSSPFLLLFCVSSQGSVFCTIRCSNPERTLDPINLRYTCCYRICLERMRKTTKTVNHDSCI